MAARVPDEFGLFYVEFGSQDGSRPSGSMNRKV